MLLAYHITNVSGKKTVSRTSDLWRQGLRLLAPAIAASVDEDAAKFGKGGIFAEVYSSAAPFDRRDKCCTKLTWHGARLYTYPRYLTHRTSHSLRLYVVSSCCGGVIAL